MGRGNARGSWSDRGGRGGRGKGPGKPSETPLKFEGEFDFEEANAQFDKDKIEEEFKKKVTISKYMCNGSCMFLNSCCTWLLCNCMLMKNSKPYVTFS